MGVIKLLVEDLPEVILTRINRLNSNHTLEYYYNHTSYAKNRNIQKSILSSLQNNKNGDTAIADLLYELWSKIALAACIVVLTITILLIIMQCKNKLKRIPYRVIPTDNSMKGSQDVPYISDSMNKNTPMTHSGVNLPFMIVSDV